ncbi:P-loop containing nucleoside triphosphate hydrolase protein [Pelagophyceae sp. CCMP2097]|nr:P-loop containing nucleoside triphosphate hydrolase protein [Pelagophyceae sp. CCMP2097]
MLDSASGVRWIDIAGLEDAKRTLHEAVVLPQLRPDLFFGLRAPPRGVLLFGPPGTGKTLLAKAVAGESSCTFFAVSASSLTSKWVGEGEKLVKALFAVGRKRSPSVVFLDELDALLGQRGASGEHEASRRLKTEFFVQLDGVATNTDQRLLFMGATNRPWDLDDALLRRVPRRILIPLPDSQARGIMLLRLISQGGVSHALTQRDRDRIVNATATFSMSDLRSLAEEAALAPLRDLGDRVRDAKTGEVRPIVLSDFTKALKTIKPSADAQTLGRYDEWAMQFGTRG